ncbi:uncharacterized protein KY384_002571 [Bacidia gigantensis]|uniref:uncharacterized protein n=1 Tax=Bacidia gigantensis TaxID=2732470 RepID=UPI001D0573B1|nr:uncharacterized protein KY384_002571 [Bacidia gigantensis]KAG8532694.1 hypothetical protein KY384_002571 [Bacidia gigantensis]
MAALEPHSELFRPSKRRKFYRKRLETVDDNGKVIQSATEEAYLPSPSPPEDRRLQDLPSANTSHDETVSVAEVLRLRKAAQRKKAGVEFTSSTALSRYPPPPSDAIMIRPEDTSPANLDSMASRFAPQTGHVTEETDKHMTAYIDAELAKRRQQSQPATECPPLSPNGTPVSPTPNPRNPASSGKLHEIDLGPDAKALNIARTQAAISGYQPPPPPPKPPKPRIGRNGKTYIPKLRPRNTRNSADVERDRVVEELLRENRLESVYDEPARGDGQAATATGSGDGGESDGAADERLAEQFRREFLDAMSQRKEKANKVPAPPGAGKPGDEKSKGPKLGGSRSERAKMREREEAAIRAAAAAKGRR